MQTEDIAMTGSWRRVADGPGIATVSHRGGLEWRIQSAAWAADEAAVGHPLTGSEKESVSLETGESMWVRASSRQAAQVTADVPVLA